MRRSGWIVVALAVLLLVVSGRLDAQMFWKEFGQGNHIPDFSQKQGLWGKGGQGPGTVGWRWTYCGPTAVANCLWYFDHLAQSNQEGTVDWTQGAGYVVPATKDPVWLVQELAKYMHCDGLADPDGNNSNHGQYCTYTGTYVDDMQTGIDEYLEDYDNSTLGLYEHTMVKPTFDEIVIEVEKCQDVILLVGFYHFNGTQWDREGGHYLTVAGIDKVNKLISVSDPCKDVALGGGAGRVLGPNQPPPETAHNDGNSVSHDTYNVIGIAPDVITPGGDWEFDYEITTEIQENFQEQNEGTLGPYDPLPGTNPVYCTWVTEVEYAIVVSPEPGTMILLGTGLIGIVGFIRRRRLN